MMCWSNTEHCAVPLYLPGLMARQLVTSLTRRSVVVWPQHKPLACLTANIHLKNKKSEGSCKSRATAGDRLFRSWYPSASVWDVCAGCQSRSVLRWHRAEGTCVLLPSSACAVTVPLHACAAALLCRQHRNHLVLTEAHLSFLPLEWGHERSVPSPLNGLWLLYGNDHCLRCGRRTALCSSPVPGPLQAWRQCK